MIYSTFTKIKCLTGMNLININLRPIYRCWIINVYMINWQIVHGGSRGWLISHYFLVFTSLGNSFFSDLDRSSGCLEHMITESRGVFVGGWCSEFFIFCFNHITCTCTCIPIFTYGAYIFFWVPTERIQNEMILSVGVAVELWIP